MFGRFVGIKEVGGFISSLLGTIVLLIIAWVIKMIDMQKARGNGQRIPQKILQVMLK